MASQYSINLKSEQTYIGSKHRVHMNDLAKLADDIPTIMAVAAAQGVAVDGPPFFRYCLVPKTMTSSDLFEVDVGFPVKEGTRLNNSESNVRVDTLPAGRYLETKMTGHPSGLGKATKTLFEWAESHDLEFDVHRGDVADVWPARVEWYESDPAEEPDMNNWVTRISIRLADQE